MIRPGHATGVRLLYAASESNADMLYATQFFAPDPFIYLQRGERSTIVLSDLELDRGRRDAAVDDVLSSSEIRAAIRKREGRRALGDSDDILEILRRWRVHRVVTPWDFPAGLADALRARGIAVRSVARFWPAREIKSRPEIRHMERAVRQAEAGLLRAIEILREARAVSGGELAWGGGVLTSERLRHEMEFAVALEGGHCTGTIVAGGRQAVDPHERGSGPLRCGETIILDIFPRDVRSGYFGDLTRTVVKGAAPEAVRRMWETVASAQKAAVAAVRPGVRGAAIHSGVKERFRAAGYRTEVVGGHRTGFFHGTGHGLGLDLHEAPRLQKAVLAAGNVFTIEPGLYYPAVGGVRIEDDVLVTARGRRVLGGGLPPVFEL